MERGAGDAAGQDGIRLFVKNREEGRAAITATRAAGPYGSIACIQEERSGRKVPETKHPRASIFIKRFEPYGNKEKMSKNTENLKPYRL